MRKRVYLVAGLLIAVVAVLAVLCSSYITDNDKRESEKIARAYLEQSPTYQFRGVEGSIELISAEQEQHPGRWDFTYHYISRDDGYGSCSFINLTEGNFTYEIEITVDNFTGETEVVHALINGRWNEFRENYDDEPI